MLLSYFCSFSFLAPYVDTSGLNCYMNSHLGVIQALEALEVYGSIGAKYIKFILEIHFLFTTLCLYSRNIYLI